jgi:hypothetical protein
MTCESIRTDGTLGALQALDPAELAAVDGGLTKGERLALILVGGALVVTGGVGLGLIFAVL